jgi:hypothetical protein
MSSITPKTPSPNATHPRHMHDDPLTLVATAHDYFDSLGLAESGELNPNMQDGDGLVSFICGTTNPPEPVLKLYDEVKPVVEGLTNVVVSAVLKQAGMDDKKKHDPLIWRGPMEAMMKGFCSTYSEAKQGYDQQVYGVEIATKFINIILDAVVAQGAALKDFTKFLQQQGDTMRTEISIGQKSYNYACVSIVHEIFGTPTGRYVYVPKFKSYFTRFTQDTFKVTSACASVDSFRFKFDLSIVTGGFMVETFQSNPDFRKKVQDFIDKFQKTNIADSENYFDRIFDSESA